MGGRVVPVVIGAGLVLVALVGVALGTGLVPVGRGGGPEVGDPAVTTVNVRLRAPWDPIGAPSGACGDGGSFTADPVTTRADGSGFAAPMTAPMTLTFAPQSGCTANGLLDGLRPGVWTIAAGPASCRLTLDPGRYAVDLESCRVRP